MGIVDGVLWVAELSVLRRFDMKTGVQQPDVKVAGAALLNDITTASSWEGQAVYRGKPGACWP